MRRERVSEGGKKVEEMREREKRPGWVLAKFPFETV